MGGRRVGRGFAPARALAPPSGKERQKRTNDVDHTGCHALQQHVPPLSFLCLAIAPISSQNLAGGLSRTMTSASARTRGPAKADSDHIETLPSAVIAGLVLDKPSNDGSCVIQIDRKSL
jgi:hypothetical protein